MDIVKHFENNLEKLTGDNWVQLVQAKEEYADKCDWSKLDGRDWAKLLKTHPQYKTKINFEGLSDWDFGGLLPDFPEFAHLCPPEKRQNWGDFIAAHPDHPVLKDFDFHSIAERDWDLLLKRQPKLIEKYPDFDDVREEDILPHGWALRVAAFPERFADRCPWDKLNSENFVQILSFQPQYEDRCDFSKFDGCNWADLLSQQPGLAEKCNWESLNGNDWELLLEWQPQFSDRCDWSKLTGHNWSMLLHVHPNFSEKYNCPWEKFTAWDFAELLDHCPQFADKCDLAKLGDDELVIIFSGQPTLIQKELIPKLGKRLIDFLCDYPEYISEYAGNENINLESVIQEIKELLEEDFHVWTEIHIHSVENAYIAKVVNLDIEHGTYRDIFFRGENSIIQADADGNTIAEAVVKLFSCIRDCLSNDFTLDFDPPSHSL